MTKSGNSVANDGGITSSERFLFRHCRQSYLQFWSYANLFRDQGKKSGGDGKELCDVMVIFGNSVVLFSDKSCRFPDTGDVAVDWGRWKRRAIDESRRQLAGAERWIRQFPNRVFTDRKCTSPLPIPLPDPANAKFHKIAVALGASDRCRRHFPGSSGSLFLITSHLAGDEPEVLRLRSQPFQAELLDEGGGLCHVVDDITLPILLRELDTIADLLEYLDTKEQMIRGDKLLSIAGEEDFLGLFLGTRAGLALSHAPSDCRMIIHEGIYRDIVQKRAYKAYTHAKSPSYFWDYIISHHSACTLDGTLVPGSLTTVKDNEELLRLLAAESRLSRRLLSVAFLELYQNARPGEVRSRALLGLSGTMFVFRLHPHDGKSEYEVYRKDRQEDLLRYCLLTAWRNQQVKTVVGISAHGIAPERDGFDITAVEIGSWTNDMLKAGAELAEEHAKDVIWSRVRQTAPIENAVAWKNIGLVEPSRRRRQEKEARRRKKDERMRRKEGRKHRR